MRILQISNYYYPNVGGIEQTARDLSLTLKGEHDVRVVCFNRSRNNTSIDVDGVRVAKAGTFIKISSQALSFSFGKLLKKEFDEFNPELVIFHYPNPFAARYLLKLLKNRPSVKLIVYWHLDIYRQKILKTFFKGQNLKLLDRANRIVSTSPNYIKGSKYLSAYGDKCTVVPSCVSDDRIKITDAVKEKCEKIRSEAEGKTIVFAFGRHVKYKGLEYLIRASKFLNDGFVVNIAGRGPLTLKLKKLAKGDRKVNFLGRLPDEDLVANLLACDIFCFPSITKNEAFGLALAEAMKLGKPSVTFNIPDSGVNYVSLNGVTGIEVENKNSIQYAKAIRRIAGDKELAAKLGENAKNRVEELFTFDRFGENVNKLIESV